MQSEHFSREINGFGVENPGNPSNHSTFETTHLHDADEFANFEIIMLSLRTPPRSLHFRGQNTTEIAGRDSKSQEKVCLD